jgi:hypothetical protein
LYGLPLSRNHAARYVSGRAASSRDRHVGDPNAIAWLAPMGLPKA